HVFEALAFIFLGPSGTLSRGRGAIPTLRAFVDHPLSVHALLMALAACVVYVLLRESSRLRPELPRARALDGLPSPIVFFGVMEVVFITLMLGIERLAA